ncbi:MAG TPA: ABC transporter permease [Bryobacteraceae bacterium]|nr:ABC transporter permease [Bryobacteraceae bacterium]
MWKSIIEDARYAVRAFHRDRSLALLATATLAVTIAANATIFGIVDSILLRPLPYPAPDRLDWISDRSGPAQQDIGAAPDYYVIRERNRIFEDVAAFQPLTATWTGIDQPEQLDAVAVSPSFFRVMGMHPLLGRYFSREEEGPKAPAIAVASYAFWRTRLGGDPRIVGKTVALDRLPRTIIGVMPQGFDFPRGTELWLPLPVEKASQLPILPTRPIFAVSMIGRRKPETRPREMAAELERLTAAVRAEYPRPFRDRGFRGGLRIGNVPLQQHLTGEIRPALLALAGAAGLLLLIACVNLANLLLARAGSRRRELAVRMAVGSGRARIIRQMLTESLVLALPGGLAGIALGWLLVRLLDAAKPAILLRYPPISMDFRVLAFTLTLTLAASVVFGMAPALSAVAIPIQEALKSAGPAHTTGRGAAMARKALLAAELGISLVLLIGAGLLARSFVHLAHTDLGFATDHLLTFRVNPVGPFNRDYRPFYTAVLERLQGLPMARSAALLTDMPLSDEDFYQTGRIRVEGRPAPPFTSRPFVNNTVVSPEFFHTLGIPLKRGRIFDAHDFVRSAPIVNHGFVAREPVVVNEALVRQILPGEDPLGRQLVYGPDEYHVSWIIVGVVGDARGSSLGANPPPMVYRCFCSGIPVFRAAFAIRTAGAPRAAIAAAGQQVRAVDRDEPTVDVKTMEERREAALRPERFMLLLLGAFAAIAVLLAAAGVYGVTSYLLAQRTRELGIRIAMGARHADLLRMIAAESLTPALAATGAGLAGAAALTRSLRSMLFGVTELDGPTFAAAALLLVLLAVAASLASARQPLRTDPASALREE